MVCACLLKLRAYSALPHAKNKMVRRTTSSSSKEQMHPLLEQLWDAAHTQRVGREVAKRARAPMHVLSLARRMPVSQYNNAVQHVCDSVTYQQDRQHLVGAKVVNVQPHRCMSQPLLPTTQEQYLKTSEKRGSIVWDERAAPAARPRHRPRACSPGTRSFCRSRAAAGPPQPRCRPAARAPAHTCATPGCSAPAAAAANPPQDGAQGESHCAHSTRCSRMLKHSGSRALSLRS